MSEPVLVILAAGMGSRFGGLKQITAVDDFGHAIIDFSMYDAYQAGFRNIVFIIKHEIENDFKEIVGHRAEKHFNVKYVYQQLDCLPEGFGVPEGRVKPWGTGHAVLCAQDAIDGPFAVINADDYYGPGAYQALYNFLAEEKPDNEHAIAAYLLKNTVTENGHVARGICSIQDGYMTDVVERTHIEKDGENAKFTENGTDYFPLDGNSPVSMNCWGFGKAMMDELDRRFPAWLEENIPLNPLKCEYFLPFVVNASVKDGTGTVKALDCREVWHGVTYKEDLEDVVSFIRSQRAAGIYPDLLLD